MSVDFLQEKIRKRKNPLIVDMTVTEDLIPSTVRETYPDFPQACHAFTQELLNALKEIVPAVRFRFANFTLMGAEGMELLRGLLGYASALGYYVLLDCVDILSPAMAQYAAQQLFSNETPWHFDGLIVPTYIGSEGLKPFVTMMAQTDKGLFGVIRTGNKSASELQDLFTGNRRSHMAAADLVNRFGEPMLGKCGYHRIGALVGAAAGDSLRSLRSKYNRMFMILDGADYAHANAKLCSNAFDRLGYGAAACVGRSVLGAWQEPGADVGDYAALAAEAAERMKKNLLRYITIL